MLNIHFVGCFFFSLLELPCHPEAVAQFLSAMLSSQLRFYFRSKLFREFDKEHGRFRTEAKATIAIQQDCHKIGPVHKWQVWRAPGSLPCSCKRRQRLFHGDKLRQMVEALLHGSVDPVPVN